MRRRWTHEMVDQLFAMRDLQKLKWATIGAAFDDTAANCCTRYNYYRAKRNKAWARKVQKRWPRVHKNGLPPVSAPPIAKTPLIASPAIASEAAPSAAVKRPRYFHDADGDLRLRIAVQGPTAGVFGDPPPGRSALDKRQQAKP